MNISFQLGQLLTIELLKKNPFEYLIRFPEGKTINIPGSTEQLHGLRGILKRDAKDTTFSRSRATSKDNQKK